MSLVSYVCESSLGKKKMTLRGVVLVNSFRINYHKILLSCALSANYDDFMTESNKARTMEKHVILKLCCTEKPGVTSDKAL
jgi:hypothetical protein